MTISRKSVVPFMSRVCSICKPPAASIDHISRVHEGACWQKRRHLSTISGSDDNLRIAIVGGGAAGMTTALHLAPLVSAGLITGPIDIYEASTQKSLKMGGRQHHPGSGSRGRDIGVGIWSTAWWPFLSSLKRGEMNRQSHITLLRDLEMCGSYVKDVGYRTPDGSWLVRSQLNANPYGVEDVLSGRNEGFDDVYDDPALLFVREKDLLSCLRNAIKIENSLGTISLHSGVRVDGIDNLKGNSGSLVCSDTTKEGGHITKQYHLIIAADGMKSTLRSRYAGHHSTYTSGMGSSQLYGINRKKASKSKQYSKWEHTTGHRMTTAVEDRDYIVFRGNAPKLQDEDGSGSFQTWGENKSMRFAAVPFRHVLDDDDEDDLHYGKSKWFEKKDDEEVWFATINDEKIYDTYRTVGTTITAEERKQLLLDAFASWHEPVRTLIETTPAENILYEMAVAHRFNASPVFDVSSIVDFEQHGTGTGYIDGPGPMLVFVGDSMMTVDPVLAQGFTIAMESAASLVRSLERIIKSRNNSPLEYQLDLLRKELKDRHLRREHRILRLLRSTELVQQLAQPSGFVSEFFATKIVRPVMKLCPDNIKKAIFGYMIKYSLGLTGQSKDRDRKC